MSFQDIFNQVKAEIEREAVRGVLREPFDQLRSQHREHQRKAVEAISGRNIGQIVVPTGTGKTRIQIDVHVSDMLEKTTRRETGVYVIGAHRLLLCQQLLDDLRTLCLDCRIPINVLYVGSARYDEKPVFEKYKLTRHDYAQHYTTNQGEVAEFFLRTKQQKRHLVVVATYHSFDRLQAIDNIDICTYDEAHTTLAGDFSENITPVFPNVKRNFFFTATPKGDKSLKTGMYNVAKYGPVIFGSSPREMIEAGEILKPKIHVLDVVAGDRLVNDKNKRMLVKTVISAFKAHKKKVEEITSNRDKIAPKLLVSCRGSDEINVLQESQTFQKFVRENGVNFFSFSSEYGDVYNFEKQPNRQKAYEKMRNLKDPDSTILAHIDILAEGIDLPSITGVLLLRELNTAKLLQTLGRSLRLLPCDRTKFYTTQSREDYVKPCAFLILPRYFEKRQDLEENITNVLKTVLNTYGLPGENFTDSEKFVATAQDDIDPVTAKKPEHDTGKNYDIIHAYYSIWEESIQEDNPENLL